MAIKVSGVTVIDDNATFIVPSTQTGYFANEGKVPLFVNQNTFSSSHLIAAGENAGSFGPITVASGTTVTIATGATYTIV